MVSYNTVLVDDTASYIVPLGYVYASTTAGYMSGLAFIDYYGSNGGLNLYGENGSIYTLLTASIMLPNNAVYDIYNNYLLIFGSPYIGSVMIYNLINGSYYFVGLSENQIIGGALYSQYPVYYSGNVTGYTTYLYDSVGSYFYVTNGNYSSSWSIGNPIYASENLVSVVPLYNGGYCNNILNEVIYTGGLYNENGSIYQFIYGYVFYGTNSSIISYSIQVPQNIYYGIGAMGSVVAFHMYNTQNPYNILLYIGSAQYNYLCNINYYNSVIVTTMEYIPTYSSLLMYGNYIFIGLGSPNGLSYLYVYDYISGSTYQLGYYELPYIYVGVAAQNSIYYSVNSGNGTGASLIQLLLDYPVQVNLNTNIDSVIAGSTITVYASVTYNDGTPASNIAVNYYVFAGIGAGNQETGLPVGTAITNQNGIASLTFVMPTLTGYNNASVYIMVEIPYSYWWDMVMLSSVSIKNISINLLPAIFNEHSTYYAQYLVATTPATKRIVKLATPTIFSNPTVFKSKYLLATTPATKRIVKLATKPIIKGPSSKFIREPLSFIKVFPSGPKLVIFNTSNYVNRHVLSFIPSAIPNNELLQLSVVNFMLSTMKALYGIAPASRKTTTPIRRAARVTQSKVLIPKPIQRTKKEPTEIKQPKVTEKSKTVSEKHKEGKAKRIYPKPKRSS